MSISESELLHACHYAIDRMIENGSVEYICFYDGKWHGTSWLDVVNEIDNRLSKIEAEGDNRNGI